MDVLLAARSGREVFIPPAHENYGILAQIYIFLGFTVILLAIRVYVSLRITHIFDMAEVTIFIATAFLVANVAVIHLNVLAGKGEHLASLVDPEWSKLQLRKWDTMVQITNFSCTLFTRYSISLYILRIRRDRPVQIALGVLMLFMTLATLAGVITISVSCVPLAALWDPAIKGRCIPLQRVYISTYVQSAFTIMVDLALTASPLVILWNVRIRRGRKTFIITLTSLGLVATATNAARNGFISNLTATDVTYDTIPTSILASIELFAAIIAACIPPCAPLITHRRQVKKQAELQVESPGITLSTTVTTKTYTARASERGAAYTCTVAGRGRGSGVEDDDDDDDPILNAN